MKPLIYLIVSNNLSILGTWLLGPVYSSYVSELDGGAFVAGSSWGVMAIVAAIIMLSFDKYIDEHGLAQPALTAGYFLLGVGSIGFWLASEPWMLYAVQSVNGAGMGLLLPSWKSLYASLEDEGREVEEWGWADGTSKFITGVGSFSGGMIVQLLSFSTLFVVMGVLQFSATYVAYRFEP